MRRVGFVFLLQDSTWTGGINYYRNLFNAICSNPERKIEPVIITGQKGLEKTKSLFPGIEVVGHPMMTRPEPAWYFRKVRQTLTGFDGSLAKLLKKKRIDVLSHSAPLTSSVSRDDFPVLGWITDFQYLRMPEFFPEKIRRGFERNARKMCNGCRGILVSSECARTDLQEFDAAAARRSQVLHFVADPGPLEAITGWETLQKKYSLEEGYFHLPNKFWAHKNHEVVIRSLGILARRGCRISVVATGSTTDDRNPDFYRRIEQLVETEKVGGQFRSLGIVPIPDLTGLMLSSIALINPSYFEGWSTSVEEAKSLGKSILLSNIGVHREQNPARGIYFDPNDPEELAELLRTAYLNWNRTEDRAHIENAKLALPERLLAFARDYERILDGLLQPGGTSHS